jgi:hypothetical protein
MFEDGLYVTETKYDPGANPQNFTIGYSYGNKTYPANSINYEICLDPSFSSANGGTPPLAGTNMGFLFPCQYWDTGLNAIFPVKSALDFSSVDAKAATAIMKSFNTL